MSPDQSTPQVPTHDKNRQLFLDALAHATRSLDEASQVMQTTANMLGRHLGCNRCAYAQVEDDENHFDLIGDYNDGVDSIVGRYAFSDFGAEVLRLMRADLPYVNPDVDMHHVTAGADLTAYRLTKIQAVICVPVRKNKRFVAAMAVHQAVPRQWSADEIELVGEVVMRCWETLDRIRSEQALREANQRLSLALSSGDQGNWSWNAGTDVVTLSYRAVDIFSLQPDTPITWTEMLQRLHPHDREPARLAVQAAIAGNSLYDIEYRVTDGVAPPRWVSAQGRSTFSTSGAVTGMIGIVRDVSRRHHADSLLRQSESKFRTFAQTMPNQVWTAMPDGLLDWINQQTLDYSGLHREELAGTGWAQIVHPDDLQLAGKTWAASLATGQPYETVFRLRRADGMYRWHLSRATAIKNDDEQVSQWVGTNTDIEDQRQAQDALQQLNATLEQRVEERTRERNQVWTASQDVLVVTGPDGTFRDVNPAFTRILGFEPVEVIGQHVNRFIAAEDVDATHQALRNATGNVVEQFENRYRHKHGGVRWFSWTTSSGDGVIYGSGRHITEEKQARAKLAAAEDALRQAQKMEAVGNLTSGIAHDFNNLLHGMVTAMTVVKMQIAKGKPEAMAKYVEMALSSAHRATALTHRLLAFSRQQPLDPKPVEVNTLVASLEDLFRRTIGPAIALDTTPCADLWLTRCDHHQLENALLNLVVNARDAMPDGGRLMIAASNRSLTSDDAMAQRDALAGEFVCITVADSGTGMTPDVLEHAFEPFFTTKPIGQGTGLGLSMIYGFVQQSGGFMAVRSQPGQGTEFDIHLPRYSGEPVTAASPAVATSAPAAAGRGRVIQLVEDDAVVRALTVEALEDAGFIVLSASDGLSGLASLMARSDIDLLVTDVGLPGLNGRQIADAARKKRPTLPILFVTGYADKGDVSAADLPAGMKVIPKPYSMDRLIEQVGRMLA